MIDDANAGRGLPRRILFTKTCAAAITSMLLITCCSCLDCEHPLSSVDTAKVDESLIGCWVGVVEPASPAEAEPRAAQYPQDTYLVIGKSGKLGASEGLMKLAIFCFQTDGVLNTNTRNFFVTKLGDHSYMNLECAHDGQKPEDNPGYCIVKYVVADDTLELFKLDQTFVKREIKAGRIAGTIGEEDGDDDKWVALNITDSTENLARWMSRNDARVFLQMNLSFKRVKNP